MNIKRVAYTTALLYALCVIFLGCSKKQADFSGDWQLHYFGVNNVAQNITLVTLSVDTSEEGYNLSGYSGVNTYSCIFNDAGSGKVVCDGDIRSTKMSGPLDVLECENKYLSFLSDASTWKVITDEGMETLEITSVSSDIDSGTTEQSTMRFWRLNLVPSKWLVTEIGGGSIDEGLSVEFKNGVVAIDTGLNEMELPYTLDGAHHALSFSQNGLTTSAAGSDIDMAREKDFISAILQTKGYIIAGNNLMFLSKAPDGDTLVTLQKAELVD